MARDIDYAAIAVKNAIVEKFGRHHDLTGFDSVAGEREILISDGDNSLEGTRDSLLAAIRAAETYPDLWQKATGKK